MAQILLYIGIGIIALGWLALCYFAFKQWADFKACGDIPRKREEIRTRALRQRTISRGVIIVGIILIIISLLL